MVLTSSSLPLVASRMFCGLRSGTEVWQSNSSSISSILMGGHHGHGHGTVLAVGFVVVFTGAQVEDCFLVGASFVLCFFASNFFFFHSTSGLPLVVTFVKSLCL